MDAECTPADWFVELVPLSAAAQAATLLVPNLRYIAVADRPCAPNQRPTKSRTITLSTSTFLGRQCFSFGAARSNDFHLPRTEGVAPHHFLLLLDPRERALYLKNTCNDGMHISTDAEHIELMAADMAVKVDHTMKIRLGRQGNIQFRIRVPPLSAPAFDAFFTLFLASIQPPSEIVPMLAAASEKRRASTADDQRAAKKQCTSPRTTTMPHTHRAGGESNATVEGPIQGREAVWGWFGYVVRAFRS